VVLIYMAYSVARRERLDLVRFIFCPSYTLLFARRNKSRLLKRQQRPQNLHTSLFDLEWYQPGAIWLLVFSAVVHPMQALALWYPLSALHCLKPGAQPIVRQPHHDSLGLVIRMMCEHEACNLHASAC